MTVIEARMAHQLQIPESSKTNSSTLLDPEVSDVLFHFDTIISELERSTLEGSTPPSLTPRSLSPSEHLLAPKYLSETLSHPVKDNLSPPGVRGVLVSKKEETAVKVSMSNGENAKEIETSPPEATNSNNVQPKVRIRDIQQQFLHRPQVKREVQVVTRDALTPGLRGNVKSLIAQMQSSSRESSPASSDTELKDAQTKSRPRSASITLKISMLTQPTTSSSSADSDVFEKEPAPLGRSISEIAQGFESKGQDSDVDTRASAPSIPRKKVQSPFILTSRDSSAEETHRKQQHVKFGVPDKQQHVKFEVPDKQQDVKFGVPDKQQDVKFEVPDETSSAAIETSQSRDHHKEVKSPPYGMQRERQDDTKKHISNGTSPPFSPTLLVESMEDARKSSPLTSHANSPSRDRSVTTVPAEPLLSPPADQPYRFRSISDVSHNTRILASFRTESSISSTGSTAEQESESLVRTLLLNTQFAVNKTL